MKKCSIGLALLFIITYSCKKDEIKSNCYSPYQNLEFAYLSGAEGCSCNEQSDSDTCVTDNDGRNVALICINGKWEAVEDGPCWPQFNE